MANEMVKIEKEDDCCEPVSSTYFPYGTRLCFEDEMIDKLGIGSLKAGDVVEVRGYAIIQHKSESAERDELCKRVEMQLIECSVNPKKMDADYVKQLYGDES